MAIECWNVGIYTLKNHFITFLITVLKGSVNERYYCPSFFTINRSCGHIYDWMDAWIVGLRLWSWSAVSWDPWLTLRERVPRARAYNICTTPIELGNDSTGNRRPFPPLWDTFLETRRTSSFVFSTIIALACLDRTGDGLPDRLLEGSFRRRKTDGRRNSLCICCCAAAAAAVENRFVIWCLFCFFYSSSLSGRVIACNNYIMLTIARIAPSIYY